MWLLLVFAAIAALVVATLLVPLELAFRVDAALDAPFEAHAHVTWLLGLVDVRLSRPRAQPQKPSTSARKAKAKGRKQKPAAFHVRAALTTPGLVTATLRFLRRLSRALAPRDVRLVARIGLDDPAETGRLWAAIAPFAAVVGGFFASVSIAPVFVEETAELSGDGVVRLIPLELLAIALAFAFSPATLRAFWRLRHDDTPSRTEARAGAPSLGARRGA